MTENKVVKNATWIIACKIVQVLLNLVVTMMTARYLGPSGYGLVNYAASVVAFVSPIMQLGFNSVLVQELINYPEEEGKTLGTALSTSLLSSAFCIVGVVAFVSIANAGEKATLIVCALYAIQLVFSALELVQYWFQAKLKSKYTSLVMLAAYVVVSAYRIFLLVSGMSIYWFAISQALDYAIIAFSLLVIYKRLGNQKLAFSGATLRRMFKKSRYYIVSNLMIVIFAQTDRIMLKLMIDDAATGYYSAAVTCAGLTGFVFTAIIDSARPSIFESKKTGVGFEKNVCALYSVIIYLSLLQSLFISLLSPIIVKILYGSAYTPTVSVLRVVVWYTTFAYLGSVRNVWILAEGKEKYLWILNLSGATLNVALNAIFIPVWGIMGAAIASLVTQIFTNVALNFIVWPMRRTNVLMLKALNPKLLLSMAKSLKGNKQSEEESEKN